MNNDGAIRTLWDYLRLGNEPGPADVIFVLGNDDFRCAERAASLWREGFAPRIVVSGATGRSTAGVFTRTEAESFGEAIVAYGVPASALTLEREATNTGENVDMTRELLAREGFSPKSVLAVQKPYMERRTLATIRHRWPEVRAGVTSPSLSFEQYCNRRFPRGEVTAMLVGEVHRIIEYPKRGWQAYEPVPSAVSDALRQLAAAGFTRHLVPVTPAPWAAVR